MDLPDSTDNSTASHGDVLYGDGEPRRVTPPAAEIIKPRNQVHWLLAVVECWIFSRDRRNFLLGLPFVVALLGLISMLWWLQHASIDPVLTQFETKFNAAVKAGDVETQELCLTGLMQWRPGVPEYRLRLGTFLVEHDRVPAGLAYILSLAPDDAEGYAPARMWLVKQARLESPWLEMKPEQIEGQLLRVVEQQTDNVDAQQMLAELYVGKQEWRLAEKHLIDAARSRPELSLAVAKLKQALKRPQQDVLQYAQDAEAALTERLSANRFDAAVRVALVEATLMLGKTAEARELLVSGLTDGEGNDIRRALSDFDLMIAERRLAETAVNRDVASQLVRGALDIDPTNPRVVAMLARLHTLGARFDPQSVEPAIAFWSKELSGDQANDATRSMLSQLYAVGGKPQQAADVLQPLLVKTPDLRLRYAALLKQAGQLESAGSIQQELLTETRAAVEANPTDIVAAARHAEVLMMAGQLNEAAKFLRGFADPAGDGRLAKDPGLRHLYGMICVELYDAWLSDPASLQEEDPLELLKDAVQIGTVAGQAIDRLVKIAFSDSPNAAEAEQLVEQFRTVSNSNGRVLSLLGLHALQSGDGGRARSYLEQANAQARGRNIMILNNLSIALIRTDPAEPKRALGYVEQALAMSPDHPDLLSTRGEVYVKLERWPEAAADLRKSLAMRPDSLEAHRLLVEVFTALKEPAQAEFHRRRITELQGS